VAEGRREVETKAEAEVEVEVELSAGEASLGEAS
jgi:hypothetical protein